MLSSTRETIQLFIRLKKPSLRNRFPNNTHTRIQSMTKVAFFWSHLPAYAQSCLRELATREEIDLHIFSIGEPPAFFRTDVSEFRCLRTDKKGLCQDVTRIVNEEKIDVVVGSGWNHQGLLRAIQVTKKGRDLLAICLADTPWKGSLTQQVRALLGRVKLSKIYDVMWVPGARSLPLAKLLGYSGTRVWQNQYCADTDRFLEHGKQRIAEKRWPESFVFAGRLVEEKNIHGLIKAFALYQQQVDHPWRLTIVGDGPLSRLIPSTDPRIDWRGARSPDEVAKIFTESGGFVLPSLFEPWGVVVHEAACTGLPIIASQDVCATAELVRDGYNGRIVAADSTRQLAAAMQWLSSHENLSQLGANSFNIAQTNTVQNWADMFLCRLNEVRDGRE
jgi:glycosyltransferase involved in cell wall biosynthesis